MKIKLKIASLAFLTLIATTAMASAQLIDFTPYIQTGAPFIDKAQGELIFTLELPMDDGAPLSAHLPDGTTKRIGTVLSHPKKTKYPAYTASKWAVPSTVAATAVNAIHLSVSVEKDRGRIISVIPKVTIAPAADVSSSFVVDCNGGEGIFGAWSPPVGSKIYIRSKDEKPQNLTSKTQFKKEEALFIEVRELPGPYMVEIENKKDGQIIAWYGEGIGARLIGRVAHPVGGVGRFEGSLFQEPSRLRANHTGVICVSTSPLGVIGGFQIMPFSHSQSKEMQHAWSATQWLIVETQGEGAEVGQPPLFSDYLVPGTAHNESLGDLWSTYGRKSLILCRINDGSWQKLPIASGKDDGALKEVTHLQIHFPRTRSVGEDDRRTIK